MSITVTGNTYPVRDELKKLGARWDGTNKQWILPDTALEAVNKLRVPIGGREQLWEPCSRCGSEPVDGSGLCDRCRGTESLTVRPLLTPDDEAQALLKNLPDLVLSLYKSASRHSECEPIEANVLGSGSPFGGGYHVEALTDGQKLYVRYVHHYDGDRDRWYTAQTENFTEPYRLAVNLLITQGGHS